MSSQVIWVINYCFSSLGVWERVGVLASVELQEYIPWVLEGLVCMVWVQIGQLILLHILVVLP